jgi:xanthine dehydrogenase accessory factor
VKAALLEQLQAMRASGQAMVLATRLSDGEQHLIIPATGGAYAPSPLLASAMSALDRERSETITIGGESWFLHVHTPPPRLILVGAVHIGQALAPLAAALGFAVTVVDPRRFFATQQRFPGVTLCDDWPDEALLALKPDRATAIVTLTHDPKLDDPALDRALLTDAFYIGALGSRKTHASRLQRLAELGHTQTALSRIHGPVGLSIGAVTAPEIAVAILAEIIQTRRGKT